MNQEYFNTAMEDIYKHKEANMATRVEREIEKAKEVSKILEGIKELKGDLIRILSILEGDIGENKDEE